MGRNYLSIFKPQCLGNGWERCETYWTNYQVMFQNDVLIVHGVCGCQFKILSTNREAEIIIGDYATNPICKAIWDQSELILKKPWRCYDMETYSTLTPICEGNPPVIGGFPSQRTGNAEFWCFICCTPERMVKQTLKLPVIWHEAHVTAV